MNKFFGGVINFEGFWNWGRTNNYSAEGTFCRMML